MSIKRVLIPAAGRGTRLDRPGMPKPLVFVAGLPMIVRTLVQCEAAGVEEAVVVVGYDALLAGMPRSSRAGSVARPRPTTTSVVAGAPVWNA